MIRYKKLGYVALNVSDLERSVAFYRDHVGLDLVERNDNHEAFFSCDASHHSVMLVQGAGGKPSFKRIGFQLEDEHQLTVAEEVLTHHGVKWRRVDPAECGRLRIGPALRFLDPIGATIELFTTMVSRPQPFLPHPIQLQQLSHVVMRVAEFEGPHKFYSDVMNFKTSDFRH